MSSSKMSARRREGERLTPLHAHNACPLFESGVCVISVEGGEAFPLPPPCADFRRAERGEGQRALLRPNNGRDQPAARVPAHTPPRSCSLPLSPVLPLSSPVSCHHACVQGVFMRAFRLPCWAEEKKRIFWIFNIQNSKLYIERKILKERTINSQPTQSRENSSDECSRRAMHLVCADDGPPNHLGDVVSAVLSCHAPPGAKGRKKEREREGGGRRWT